MKIDIILCGVGGMGALSSAAIISKAALDMGWYMKQAETHGMSLSCSPARRLSLLLP